LCFRCGGSFPQETRLIYEKITGLLLYVDTTGQNYHLEMIIENYELDQNVVDIPSEIPSFSLIVIVSVVLATTLIIIKINKKKMRL